MKKLFKKRLTKVLSVWYNIYRLREMINRQNIEKEKNMQADYIIDRIRIVNVNNEVIADVSNEVYWSQILEQLNDNQKIELLHTLNNIGAKYKNWKPIKNLKEFEKEFTSIMWDWSEIFCSRKGGETTEDIIFYQYNKP